MSIEIHELGGACPVQGEGTFDGVPFYFRARGNRWSCHVGGSRDFGADDCLYGPGAHWHHYEPYAGEPLSAGWMSTEEARRFIAAAYERWRAETAATEQESER